MELLSKENARKNNELGERVNSQKQNNNGTLHFEYGFTGYQFLKKVWEVPLILPTYLNYYYQNYDKHNYRTITTRK